MATCYDNQFEFTFKQATPALLLLWGDDAGAIRQAAQFAVAQWGVPLDDPFLAEKLSVDDIISTPGRLPDSAATMPLGGGRRVILLNGTSGEESTNAIKDLTEAVKTTLAMPLADVLIVLPLPRVLEKASPLVKLAEGAPNALSVRFFLPKARDLGAWLKNEFKGAHKRPEPQAMSLLVDHLGADREQARREVEKLLLYVGEAETVTAADVLASLSGAIPADVFTLAEAVGRRDLRQTDRLLCHMQEEGQDLNAAFSVTLRHLSLLKTAQELQQAKQPPDAILKASGKARAPKTAQNEFLQQVRNYPHTRLAALPAYAVETLTQSRSGLLDSNLVLSRALLALAS
ncbi:MAG: DNA polymerase III subunit delta [Pseudomonadaceae bacterium]|nr:DNA polymerase III subunit delta [Pseudomonadaceae bacterium]